MKNLSTIFITGTILGLIMFMGEIGNNSFQDLESSYESDYELYKDIVYEENLNEYPSFESEEVVQLESQFSLENDLVNFELQINK